MAKYDSKGVPILGFHNPAGSIFYPKGLFTYAMGNTRGRDLTELLGTTNKKSLDALLLASGDVRNILHTTSELSLRKTQSRPKSLNFHVNDYDSSVVARNAVILDIVSRINPEVRDDLDFLWNIWYNMTLSKDHFDRLREVISSLNGRKFDGDERVLKFQDTSVLQECQDIWKDWRDLHLDVKSVKEERDQLIVQKIKTESMCSYIKCQMLMATSKTEDIIKPPSPFVQEIEHWFKEGSTDDKKDFINPTLIRPFVHKWKVHYASCAFEGYLPIQREDLLRCGSLTSACKENLKLLVKRFQQFQQEHNLKITLWTGDALWLCTSGLPQELLFDVIDSSNVSDHIGLLNVLVCCSTRLKRPLESQMFTSSILWSTNCSCVEEYYNRSVGVHKHLLPTVLGLKLAVDLDLGSRKLRDTINSTNEEILCWVKAERERTLLTLDKGSDVVRALLTLVERCFNLVEQWNGLSYGAHGSSPLTFLRIVQQIQPLIEGGATRIFDLLEDELPVNFHQKFGLSWNLLKAVLAKEKEPIVEVNIFVDAATSGWYNGTPMPMIVFTDQAINQFNQLGLFREVFGLYQPCVENPVIYNSVRYDEKSHIVTFHLLEKDWNELKTKSWLHIKANNLMPTIESVPVFLGDASAVKGVCYVDPVETFGLFSVQIFNVSTTKEDSQLLKVVSFVENELSYSAELAIQDLAKCKKETMEIRFQPENCPTSVSLLFEGVVGCSMYFSCSVENSSTFKISRNQGKVLCQFPKREDGTVGELVLGNPAPLPFHAMARWNATSEDMQIYVCEKMFHTEADIKQRRKKKKEDPSPFYRLRESIELIFNTQIEDSELKIFCVEELVTIVGLYQTPEDILQKKGLIIKVEEIYRWKHLPIAKVIFYDCQKFGKVILKNPTAPKSLLMVQSFFLVTGRVPHKVQRILADKEELELFRKMLYTNAARVTQERDPVSVWSMSFICPLFSREKFLETVSQDVNEDPSSPFLLSVASESDNQLSETGYGGRMDQLFTQSEPPQSTSSDQRDPECNFCHKRSGNLKRCVRCKKVSYCNKDCQKSHWKRQHKNVCRSTK